MSQDRTPMDRYLDRLERLLIKCNEADKAARKERRAQWRAQQEKLKPPEEGQSNSENDEPKH